MNGNNGLKFSCTLSFLNGYYCHGYHFGPWNASITCIKDGKGKSWQWFTYVNISNGHHMHHWQDMSMLTDCFCYASNYGKTFLAMETALILKRLNFNVAIRKGSLSKDIDFQLQKQILYHQLTIHGDSIMCQYQ